MALSRSGPRQRAAHYREQAKSLRQMAETESVERIRTVLCETADRYQALADLLSDRIADRDTAANAG
jgi:hypothetical protein